MSNGPDPRRGIVVLGSFVADVTFRTARLPVWGETLMGSGSRVGPGGKGSNQAVAAARAGAAVHIVTRLGRDAFGDIAWALWADAGIDASLVSVGDVPTGTAAILVDEAHGENAIVVVPGACFTLTPEDVDRQAAAIAGANILLAQLELPLATVERGLTLARESGVTTILNPAPAPAEGLPASLLGLVDYLLPNETEAALLSGLPVRSTADAEVAAKNLQLQGARHVIVTLGAQGALVCPEQGACTLAPSFRAGSLMETTGAGDAFCGAFAAALAEGLTIHDAASRGCAGAGISVTRAGAALAMPTRAEIEQLLQANKDA